MSELSPANHRSSTTPRAWPKFPEQNADGIDLSLIRRNLALSPAERVRQMDRLLRDVARIRDHARRIV